MGSRVRTYTLHETPDGFSSKSIDYDGQLLMVAARSVKQAYWLAGHDEWASRADPVGILSEYRRGRGTRYWFDPTTWTHDGDRSFEHGKGVRHIEEVMDALDP